MPHARAPDTPPLSSPLGASYVLLPVPSDDGSLLGRVLAAPPQAGRALEELTAPNPCAQFLTAEQSFPGLNQFEDATELGVGARGHAVLGAFGFGIDAQRATHFVYRLNTEKRATRVDTVEYAQCCAQAGCGFGYVSALVYGDGEYASAEESTATVQADFVAASASGSVALKVLHRRHVRGWVAALIHPNDQTKAATVDQLGREPIAGVEGDSLPAQVKSIYEAGKVTLGTSSPGNFAFKVGGQWITEREFARRYRNVVGSDELQPADSAWVSTGGLVAAAIGVAAAGAGTILLLSTKTPCRAGDGYEANGNGTSSCYYADTGQRNPNGSYTDTGIFGLGLGGAIGGGLLTGIGGVYALTATEGDVEDHRLTEYDARIFADRYNRALLRSAARDLSRVGGGAP
jgi:hypothetical protein